MLVLLPLGCASSKNKPTGGCQQWVGQTIRAQGAYFPADESYARRYAFALKMNCDGSREDIVTVQRSTGGLPICANGQPVEVIGKLTWNRALVDPHYEINSPQTVTCR